MMKYIDCLLLLVVSYLAVDQAEANGAAIVAAARSQIGVPYSWGGGGVNGKSKGIGEGAHTVGFDCSGLAQYSVFHGAHKTIARVAAAQYTDKHCHHVPYAKHQPGDLVFFESGGNIHHVAIISGPNKMIQAPHTGDHVRESTVYATGRVANVARCW